MVKTYLIIIILFVFTLTACVTGSDPSGSQASLVSSHTQTCPVGITAKVDGKPITITAPNPFGKFVNPGLDIINDHFGIGLLTQEVGLFELLDFKAANLKVGTFSGDQFRLILDNSPYSSETCTHTKYKSASKLIIEKYNAETDRKLEGCFYGKLDCAGQLLEINAAISGQIP